MPTLGVSEIKDFQRFKNELKAHSKLNFISIPKSVCEEKIKTTKASDRVVPSENCASTSLGKFPSLLKEFEKSHESREKFTNREVFSGTNPTDDDCICIEPVVEEILIDDDNETIYFEDRTGGRIVDLAYLSQTVGSNNLSNKKPSDTENDEIIILDDTIDKESNSQNFEVDESVVFVSETLPDFIPLVSTNVPKPLISPEEVSVIRERRSKRDSLFTAREKEQLKIYNENTYNPNANEQLELQRKNPKRTVIIDGSNVAFSHGRKKYFSGKGLRICIEYFQRMGHEVKAVLPSNRLDKLKLIDPVFKKLYIDGVLIATPCKNLPGLSSNSYDDRFILQLASNYDGAIVSNDNYRDLINENAAFKKLIENRVTGYTWCDDMFMLPKDPYGKFGPTLHSILNREIEEKSF